MTSTTHYSPVDRLYVDSIHVTSVERDWSEGYTETWDYIEAPECPVCSEYGRWIAGDELHDEDEMRSASALEDDEYESPDYAGETWEAWRCANVDCERFGSEIEPEDGGPMMNYSYALPSKSFGSNGGYDQSDAEKIAHLPLCIVTFEDTGNQALALTGGGMDLSWEICEAFMLLGHLPPLAYCDLPRMAGMDMDERRRWVLAGCLRSCDAAVTQAQYAAERLRRNYAE